MIGVLIILFSAIAYPTTENVGDSYQKKKEEFIRKEELNRNILSDIYLMQKRLKKISSDKNKLHSEKIKIEEQISRLEPVVESANKKLSIQKIEIQKRLQFIFKFQDMSFVKILFSSQSPAELDRNLRILKQLTEKDYVNLRNYFKNTKILNAKKEELKSKKENLKNIQNEINQKETLLLAESEKKSKNLRKIEKQKSKLMVALKGIREKSIHSRDSDGKKEEFLQTILEPLFFERKGSLRSPIQASIFQGYGDFEHPTFQTKFRHKGLFFAAKNNDVFAVAPGDVAHVEKIPGQGFTIIVDHGDHYFSVYSYLSSVDVIKGERLLEGREIGETGALHPFFGSGLYFELRHFSEPVNPKGWIKL